MPYIVNIFAIAVLSSTIYSQSSVERYVDPNDNKLIEIASSEQLWTGVAVSQKGRIFVNYPRWSNDVELSVGEIIDDSVIPYPNSDWNLWPNEGLPQNTFYCVQSVFIDDNNYLWILDSGNPGLLGIVDNAPKLLKVDLVENSIIKKYYFNNVLFRNSYLNDVRIDNKNNFAYITDSGTGAIIVLNLLDGDLRSVLQDHQSTKAEDININIEGFDLSLKIHADGIALSPDCEFLYYQALSSRTLYRISTAILRDFSKSDRAIENEIEPVCDCGVNDGITFDDEYNLYLTSLENNSIIKWNPKNNVSTILIKDKQIKWPDSISIRNNSDLYFTTSQLHLGQKRKDPYRIYKIKINE